ncbi:DUF6443 domain-containing protein [Flavobacterium sp. CF108]|uniref:DUF6443 domain-containing protein n=1 Tax=unclassified Flavobacterium TaxID=196869 RepID=UPI0009FA959C|nr:RHS repeat-associated core domain-containing protein [Flavobacterium sp. CF108]
MIIMKKYLYILLLFPMIIIGQSGNFIKSTTYKQASSSTIASPTSSQASQEITYFDGLGRPIQKIANAHSPLGKDVIVPIEYDDFGRQVNEYLPYTSSQSNMAINNNTAIITALTNQYQTFYNDGTPYSGRDLEVSPLSRVLKQAAPGTAWALGAGHEIKMDYQTNVANEVKLFTANTSWDVNLGLYTISLTDNGYYGINELYKTITYDENTAATPLEANGSTVEFKNKQGQVVLKRTYGKVGTGTINEKHDTYYVYDIYGNLTYVIPPKAVDLVVSTSNSQTDITSTAIVTSGNTLNLKASNSIKLLPGFHAQSGSTFSAVIDNSGQSILDDLCYQYKYDHLNRLVEKKLPGKQWEYIVYDKLDRPVLTQDANLRAQNKWLFTKYDAFNRPIYAGDYTKTSQNSRIEVQGIVDASIVLFENKQGSNSINNTTIYYSNNAFPNTGINIFTINYYDDYNFDINGGVSENVGTITPSTATRSLPTGSKIRILGTNNWTTNVIYYDQKGRSIYNYSKNDFLGLTQKVKTELDFEGKATKTTTKHIKGATVDIIDTFTYDNQSRLLTQTQKINSQAEEVIVSNKYDELGQLFQKGVGGKLSAANRLQTVDYVYNIRGWLKGINDTDITNGNITMASGDLFGFKINYNNPITGTPLYNGNISQTFWKTTNPVNTSLRNYTYSYDALNRLTEAVDNSAINPGRYNEQEIKYDKNGNITRLLRLGNTNSAVTAFGTMDNLFYTYDAGNKLIKVEDPLGTTEGFQDGSHIAQEYTYDDNGNMKTDANKGITSIIYNHLNLPTDITLAAGAIHYDYDAAGVKQRKIAGTITTDYAAGFQYEKVGTGTQDLKFFPTTEGYAENNSGTFAYIYQYKDHLGNVRLAYKDVGTSTPSLQIVEESNYYPFGMKQKVAGEVINQTGYKYKYNGKEFQDELGLNFYDYGARKYDPALGHWMNMDPLSEKYETLSPYNYVSNNPVNAIDPDGRLIVYVNGLLFSQALKMKLTSNDYKPERWGTQIQTDKLSFNGEDINYWDVQNSEGITTRGEINRFFNDDHNVYVNGSHHFRSQASERFEMGKKAGNELIAQLQNGTIELTNEETIKIVGHSQGAAHAAGMLTQLLDSPFANRLEAGIYLSPHQPGGFTHPKEIFGVQFSTKTDIVSSRAGVLGHLMELFNGSSELKKITGSDFMLVRPEHKGNKGGHDVESWDNILKQINDFLQK